ncbi:hypothetical protein [Kribbella sp. NPDC051137]|uniref:hypothetical protein n=1 Tax=Kribbella sp. NPDC051137 TaxID=3155045 RepID=UPI00343B429E
MGASRFYSAGVRAALFTLSRGRCYEPTCQQLVTRFIDGEPSVNIQIAHIHALEDNGPRFLRSMPIPKRNGFANLLLLCQAHHNRIDSKTYVHKYPATLLRKWKQDREGSAGEALANIQIKDDAELRTLFADVLQEVKAELLEAIQRVEKVSLDQAALLRTLVDESYGWPRLNEDAIASLERSAKMLVTLEDTTGLLATTARSINEDTVTSIRFAVEDLKRAVDEAKYIEQSLNTSLEGDQFEDERSSSPVIHVDTGKDWRYFFRGVGVGAALVVVVILAIVITNAVNGS